MRVKFGSTRERSVSGDPGTGAGSANHSAADYDALQKAAERISSIVQLLDEKEMRWLELSEKV